MFILSLPLHLSLSFPLSLSLLVRYGHKRSEASFALRLRGRSEEFPAFSFGTLDVVSLAKEKTSNR